MLKHIVEYQAIYRPWQIKDIILLLLFKLLLLMKSDHLGVSSYKKSIYTHGAMNLGISAYRGVLDSVFSTTDCMNAGATYRGKAKDEIPMDVKMVKFILPWVYKLVLLFLFTAPSIAAEFTAEVDRSELNTDEHITLTLSLSNSDTRLRAQGVSPNIDLSVLTSDFDLGTPEAKNHYNIYRNRGRSTSSLSISLFPKKTGNLTIPAFRLDGLTTAVIPIKVQAPSDAPLAFTQAAVNQQKIWVGQQLVIHLDLFTRIPLESAKLGGALETEPTPLELIEHIRLPKKERTEEHHGFTYQVLRTSWVLHPMEAGSLVLYLPDAWLVSKTKKRIRLPQSKLTVDVQTLPLGNATPVFIGKPKVSITAISTEHVSNQISNWLYSLTIANHSSLLPATLSFPSSDKLKLYIGKGQLDRLEHKDTVEFKMNYTLSVLPKAAGKTELPPLTLRYFDTDSESLQTLTLPGPSFTAVAATHSTEINTALSSGNTIQAQSKPTLSEVLRWQISTAALLLIWLSTLYFFLKRQRREKKSTTPDNSSKQMNPIQPHIAELLQAFDSRTLEEGLQLWEQTNTPSPILRSSIKTVQAHYYADNKQMNNSELEVNVAQAIDIIKSGATNTNKNVDKWMPKAFTAG